MDADGSILWANRAACQSVDMTREQVIGHFCYEIPADWHESWGKCPAVKAIEAGERMEFERTLPEGRTWLIQAVPVRDQKGGIMGAVEIALDITRYKRAEEALHELQREQQELEARAGVDDPAEEET